jgi:hypothetical protein
MCEIFDFLFFSLSILYVKATQETGEKNFYFKICGSIRHFVFYKHAQCAPKKDLCALLSVRFKFLGHTQHA